MIGENILNFHGSDDCYYEEWKSDCNEGWIVPINFRDHVLDEMKTGSESGFGASTVFITKNYVVKKAPLERLENNAEKIQKSLKTQ